MGVYVPNVVYEKQPSIIKHSKNLPFRFQFERDNPDYCVRGRESKYSQHDEQLLRFLKRCYSEWFVEVFSILKHLRKFICYFLCKFLNVLSTLQK